MLIKDLMKKEDEFKFDLQLFNDNKGDDPNSNDNKGDDKQATGGESGDDKQDKTFTQDDVNKIIQERLAREKKSFEVELRERIEKEKEEAKRLAELSAEEREKELAKKQAEELEKTKAELRRIRLEQDAIDRLNEDGLDIKFKDFLIGENEEDTHENIKTFKTAFDEAVQAAVEERLKGTTPKNGSTPLNSNNTDLSIDKIAQNARII